MYEAEKSFTALTNATSHFLYNNFQHFLVKVFFFVPPVHLLVFFSILMSLGSLWRLWQIAQLWIANRAAATLLPLAIAFSFTFWQQTEIIEVYAFNNFLFLSFLLHALRDLKTNEPSAIWKTSLWYFLCLLTHIQHILSIPFFLFYLWKAAMGNWIKIGIGLGFVALAFAILLAIPAITHNHSLAAVFFDNQFQNDILGLDFKVLLRGFAMAMGFLVYNFHVLLVPGLIGWWKLWKGNRPLFWQLALLFVPYFGFAVKYSVTDNHVFFLLSYFVLLLPLIFAVKDLGNWFVKWWKPTMIVLLLLPPLFYAGTLFGVRKMGWMAGYDTEKAYKGGLTHLLWPGKATASDPLVLAAELRAKGVPPDSVEWNYPIALEYLEWKGL